jgi:Ran GTPase-activating protein (RanGAP) involved in mRNA processing and transport
VSVNILYNDIGNEQAQNLATILKKHATLKSLCGNKGDESELNLVGSRGKQMGADGAIMLAPEIVANGALEKLLMADNGIATKEAGEALGQALASNTVLKELDVSNNARYTFNDGPAFATALADGVRANGALVKFDISNNKLCAKGTKLVTEALKGNQIMTEISISGNYMTYNGSSYGDMSGVIAISTAIPTMGALTSLNLSRNSLKSEGAKHVAEAIKHHVSALRFD